MPGAMVGQPSDWRVKGPKRWWPVRLAWLLRAEVPLLAVKVRPAKLPEPAKVLEPAWGR